MHLTCHNEVFIFLSTIPIIGAYLNKIHKWYDSHNKIKSHICDNAKPGLFSFTLNMFLVAFIIAFVFCFINYDLDDAIYNSIINAFVVSFILTTYKFFNEKNSLLRQ
jgi:hypothetical protein